VIGPGGVDIEPGLLGDFEELIELGQAFGIESTRLLKKRAEGEENPNAVESLLAQALEIASGGYWVESFPQLRCPAGSGPEIIDADRGKGSAGRVPESPVLGIQSNAWQRRTCRIERLRAPATLPLDAEATQQSHREIPRDEGRTRLAGNHG